MKQGIGVFDLTFLPISETFVYRQVQGAAAQYGVTALCFSRENEDRFPWPNVLAMPLWRGEYRLTQLLARLGVGPRPPTLPFRVFLRWKRDLKAKQIGLLHAHFGPAGMLIRRLAESLRIPLLVTFHGYDASLRLRDPRYVDQLKTLFTYAHGLAVCDAIRERLIAHGVPAGRIRTHYLGVPLNEFRYRARDPIPERVRRGESIRFVQVSRFFEKKGHDYTINALQALDRGFKNWHLALIGDGPLLPVCKQLVTKLGLEEKVSFLGPLNSSEIEGELDQADAFLHHSVEASDGDQEGIPVSIMEAMAMGLPVVSTFHSGIPELIEQGVSGFLVKERDVEGYATALQNLLDSGQALGRAAHERVRQKFDLERSNSELRLIYADLLQRGRCS
ncbi:MAG: glycosyltransferase [Gammaproteobacteria bacterium]